MLRVITTKRSLFFVFIYCLLVYVHDCSTQRHLLREDANATLEDIFRKSKHYAMKMFMSSYFSDPLCSNPTFTEALSKKRMGLQFLRRRCSNLGEKGPTSVAHLRSRRKSNREEINKAKNQEVYKKIARLIERSSCQPLKIMVEIPNPFPLKERFVPCEVPVKRCGGCCLSELEDCLPISTKIRKFKVLKHMKRQPMETVVAQVEIEEHLKCDCKCKTKREDCGPGQMYEEENCLCRCPPGSHMSCPQTKIWNEGACQCVCRNINECTTGMIFNPDTCLCDQQQHFLDGFFYNDQVS